MYEYLGSVHACSLDKFREFSLHVQTRCWWFCHLVHTHTFSSFVWPIKSLHSYIFTFDLCNKSCKTTESSVFSCVWLLSTLWLNASGRLYNHVLLWSNQKWATDHQTSTRSWTKQRASCVSCCKCLCSVDYTVTAITLFSVNWLFIFFFMFVSWQSCLICHTQKLRIKGHLNNVLGAVATLIVEELLCKQCLTD